MSIADDPYRLLGVGRTATEQDITTAFRKASLKVHPDRCPNDPNAAAKFGALIKARDLLLSQTKHCVTGNSGGRAAGGGMSWVVTTVPSGGAAPATRNVASALPRQVHTGGSFSTGWPQASAPGTAWPWAAGAGTKKKEVASPQKQVFISSSSRTADFEFSRNRTRVGSEPVEEASVKKDKKQGAARAGKERTETAKPEKQAKVKAKKKEISRPPKGRKTNHNAASPESPKKKAEEVDAGAEDEEEEDDEEAYEDQDEERKATIEEIYADDVNEDDEEDDDEEDDEDYEPPDEPEDDGLEDDDFQLGDTKGVEAPASSPARKRRRISGNSSRKKRAEPLDGLRAALEDSEHAVEGMSMSNRQMLATVCTSACAEARVTPVDSRHEFHTSVLEMIGEVLSGLHDTFKRLADEACEVARQATEDVARKEQLQTTREACSSELSAARSDVSRRSQELGCCKDAIVTARGSLRTVVQQAAVAEHNEQDCRQDLDKVRDALKTFHALEADGAPAKPVEAKRMVKVVEGQMAKVGVHETLFARVALQIIPALQQNPDNRSSFDDSALSAAEGCFTTYIQEREQKLEGLERASASLRDRAQRAKTQIDQAKKRTEAAKDAIREAKEVRRECGTALSAAVEAQVRHRQEVADLVRKFKQRSAALADLEDLKQAFGALVAGTRAEPA